MGNKMKHIKLVVEKHPDTYVAYPLGLKGVVIGQGDTYESAIAGIKSAITLHIEMIDSGVLYISRVDFLSVYK